MSLVEAEEGKVGVSGLRVPIIEGRIMEHRFVNGKSIELVKILKKRKINIACVQGTSGLGPRRPKLFYEDLDEVVRGIPNTEKIVIGGDFNGHIRATSNGFDDVHGGFGFSSVAKTQIDYFLLRKGDRGLFKDCKVIPSENLTTQHKLLVMDLEIRKARRKKIAFDRRGLNGVA
ncbi:hypothetical protein H5410_001393 [Solanum commersonii]|uniref:Craniofacial development protein 2-like n=1 Tax=Solanum commersonii TaxID=4109 RepID=A0A9J6AZ11_SOLCO|nr:hypothetical protein H5410_001393 [Solanum commersonii]